MSVDLEQDQAVQAATTEALTVCEQAQGLVVVDEASANMATDLLKMVKTHTTALEKLRKKFTKPLLDHKKSIDEFFNQQKAPLTTADSSLRGTLLSWRKAEQVRLDRERREAEAEARRQQEEAEKAQAAAAKAQEGSFEEVMAEAEAEQAEEAAQKAETVAQSVAPPPKKQQTETGAASVMKKRWVFKIETPDEVPRAYCRVDDQKIRAAIRAGVREIPGISIYQEDELAIL